jgi:hypothetical protein
MRVICQQARLQMSEPMHKSNQRFSFGLYLASATGNPRTYDANVLCATLAPHFRSSRLTFRNDVAHFEKLMSTGDGTITALSQLQSPRRNLAASFRNFNSAAPVRFAHSHWCASVPVPTFVTCREGVYERRNGRAPADLGLSCRVSSVRRTFSRTYCKRMSDTPH